MTTQTDSITIIAHYVERSEGMVWRYTIASTDIDGVALGTAPNALWILTEDCGLSSVSARGVLALAESISPRPVTI